MSIGIILASHGDFAVGVKRTGDMIFGNQEKIETCVLMPDESIEKYRKKVEDTFTKFDTEDEILCLVDLWGGTPFNQINQIREESSRRIEIVSGLNIPMLLQAYGDRFNSSYTLTDIVKSISIEGKKGIKATIDINDGYVKKQYKDNKQQTISNKMSDLGIRHVRLDERLIHGQVATLWLGNLGASRVMIIDDNVVDDSITKASLKAAVPGGVKLSILKIETAASRLKEGVYQGQKVMIITKEIQTIFDLIELGVPIETFNLGNSSPKENTKQVKKSVYLTEKEINNILQLEKEGVVVTAQMVPMEEERSFSQFYGK